VLGLGRTALAQMHGCFEIQGLTGDNLRNCRGNIRNNLAFVGNFQAMQEKNWIALSCVNDLTGGLN
jgi:hypothetical protein